MPKDGMIFLSQLLLRLTSGAAFEITMSASSTTKAQFVTNKMCPFGK